MMLEILGLTAAACITIAGFPQIVAVLRGGAAGVSLGTWCLLAACSAVWLGYGIGVGKLSVVVGNVASLLPQTVLVVMLVKERVGSWPRAFLVVPGIAALTAAAAWLPVAVAGWTGVALGVSLAVPQLRESWDTWRTGSQSNVALGSWCLVAAGQALWLAYGIGTWDIPIIAVNCVAGASSLTVLSLEIRAGAKRRSLEAATS